MKERCPQCGAEIEDGICPSWADGLPDYERLAVEIQKFWDFVCDPIVQENARRMLARGNMIPPGDFSWMRIPKE